MQKLIIIVFLLFIGGVIFGNGNNTKKTTKFQGQVVTKLSKTAFLHKSNKWVNYHSDSEEKLIIDKALGHITGKCSKKVFINFSGIPVSTILHYTIEMEFHDGEVNYKIYHISYESVPDKGYKPRILHIDKWMDSQSKSSASSIMSKYRTKTIYEIGEIIGHISSYLNEESSYNN